MLDEREMQYLYKDGDSFHFMDTSSYEQMHIPSEVLGDSVNYLIPDAIIKVEFYGSEPVGIELPPTVDLKVEDTGPRHQRRDRQRAGQAGDARNRPGRPGPAVREHRRHDPRQHRNRGVPVAGVGGQSPLRNWTLRVLFRNKVTVPSAQHHGHSAASHGSGWIEVITGSMFSGKSEELIRRLRRAQIAQAEGPDLQAEHRQPLQRGPHHLAQRDADPVGEPVVVARPAGAGRCRHRGRRHRRGAVLRRRAAGRLQHAGRSGQARHRRRARSGLPGQAVRADAAAAGDRRIHHQDAGDLHGLRRAREPHAASRREQRARAGRRAGHVRGALPPLFRSVGSAADGSRAPLAGSDGTSIVEWGQILDMDRLPQVLFVLGVGFLLANLRLLFQFVRFLRLRSSALLTWPGRRPPFYGLLLVLGAVLSVLIVYKLAVLRQHPKQVFGER